MASEESSPLLTSSGCARRGLALLGLFQVDGPEAPAEASPLPRSGFPWRAAKGSGPRSLSTGSGDGERPLIELNPGPTLVMARRVSSSGNGEGERLRLAPRPGPTLVSGLLRPPDGDKSPERGPPNPGPMLVRARWASSGMGDAERLRGAGETERLLGFPRPAIPGPTLVCACGALPDGIGEVERLPGPPRPARPGPMLVGDSMSSDLIGDAARLPP
mmetsp:Transcript_28700/g.60912  ORF Transcript_28700/g.60912 Transcript_28700/m.60912 type:complete len:217 (-) Transcript_28700:366-1016(-)